MPETVRYLSFKLDRDDDRRLEELVKRAPLTRHGIAKLALQWAVRQLTAEHVVALAIEAKRSRPAEK